MNTQGKALNINADEAALHLAAGIPVTHLVFLSDIPGIVSNGEVISTLNESQAKKHIDDGTITGGMIPKVRSSLNALHRGVKDIIIGQYAESGNLQMLLKGTSGTAILSE
jgi:acetylglutamate kinase